MGFKDAECIGGTTEESMMGSGRRIKCMGTGHSDGRMEECIEGTMRWMRRKATGCLNGRMGESTRGTGTADYSMDKEC